MGKRFVLNRRALLRGALAVVGAARGRPTLAMLFGSGREAAAAPAEPRYLAWFFGNGVLPTWDPPTQGHGWTSDLTRPLDLDPAVKQYVSILTGFDNRC